MIFFVDIERDYGYTKYSQVITIHRLDTLHGTHKPTHHNAESIQQCHFILIDIVRKEQPSQIIFDKAADGLIVFDLFKHLLDRIEDVKMMENGMLYYN